MRFLQRCVSRGARSFSASTANKKKPPLCVVDLRGSGWSLLERLCVEEFLTQTKPKQSWLVIGSQEPTHHRHLQLTQKAPRYIEQSILAMDDHNPSCAIVVSDKNQLNTESVARDGILCLEGRPFLGESVVVDHSSVVTTLIAEEEDHASTEFMMEQLWKPTFDVLEELRLQQQKSSSRASSPLTMVMDTKSCSKGDNSGRMIRLEDLGIQGEEEEEEWANSPSLSLSQRPPNDIFLGEFWMGKIYADDSTQSVRSLFWWDYDQDHFSYLNKTETTPPLKLQDVYPSQATLFEILETTCRDEFEVTEMNPRDMARLMAQEKTGLQDWWDKKRSSWKIVQEL